MTGIEAGIRPAQLGDRPQRVELCGLGVGDGVEPHLTGLDAGRPAAARGYAVAQIDPPRGRQQDVYKRQANSRFFRPLRQIIESVNDTLKGQLDLELPGGRTPAGVCVRIAQRILALVAAIWHNDQAGAAVLRNLTAYDH